MSFPAENIRLWAGKDVVDSKGDKIGSMESIYYDTGADEASFAAVQVGLVGKHLVFAPLHGAVVGPGYVKVQVDKKMVRDSPSLGVDGELTRDQEAAVFAHYGLPYESVGDQRRLGRR
ncbi:MAG TPA: PRC-barrel domain-containing protein [Amnibacterium sp.]